MEDRLTELVRLVEAARTNGDDTKPLEDEMRKIQAERGPRRILGTSRIAAPLPGTGGG